MDIHSKQKENKDNGSGVDLNWKVSKKVDQHNEHKGEEEEKIRKVFSNARTSTIQEE